MVHLFLKPFFFLFLLFLTLGNFLVQLNLIEYLQFNIFEIGKDEFPQSSDENEFYFSVLLRKFMAPHFGFVYFIELSIVLTQNAKTNLYALLEGRDRFIELFDVDIALPYVFQEVSCVIIKGFRHLDGLVVLQNLIGEVALEIFCRTVFVQLIYNPDLVINLLDILGPQVIRNLNLNIISQNQLASLVQPPQLNI